MNVHQGTILGEDNERMRNFVYVPGQVVNLVVG
jgi:hypothetical protein